MLFVISAKRGERSIKCKGKINRDERNVGSIEQTCWLQKSLCVRARTDVIRFKIDYDVPLSQNRIAADGPPLLPAACICPGYMAKLGEACVGSCDVFISVGYLCSRYGSTLSSHVFRLPIRLSHSLSFFLSLSLEPQTLLIAVTSALWIIA